MANLRSESKLRPKVTVYNWKGNIIKELNVIFHSNLRINQSKIRVKFKLRLWSQLWNCCRLRQSRSQIGKYELRPWSQSMFSELKHNIWQNCRNGFSTQSFQLYSNVIIIPRDGGHLKSNKNFYICNDTLRLWSQFSPYTSYICDQSHCLCSIN